jgi:hypothetical protein
MNFEVVHKTAYETSTGRILYTTSGVAGGVVFPEIDGISYADGIGDPVTQEVVEGQIVSKSAAVLEQQEIDAAWVSLRAERSRRLYASDWTQVPDAPIDQAAWATYRQALRDLPDNTADPRQVIWPTRPEA